MPRRRARARERCGACPRSYGPCGTRRGCAGHGTLVTPDLPCKSLWRVPLFRITNDPRPYAWGSRTAIAALRGVAPSGEPEAELWFGTHHGSPARVVGEDAPLTEVIAAEGGDGHLPYLLKLLA